MAPATRSSAAVCPFNPKATPACRRALILVLNAFAVAVILPTALPAIVERRVSNRSEVWFQFFGQLFAGVPGQPGSWLRRAYYWWTLERCSLRASLGYGSYFSHRTATVADHVYVGPYSVIGCADLGMWALVGTRASLLSGGALHEMDAQGRWLPSNFDRAQRIRIGAHAWVGEGAIVMADVGTGAMVAAGAVVSAAVADGVMVGGNPARFVRHLRPVADAEEVLRA
jgi:virginiamycin A acetyltransferase